MINKNSSNAALKSILIFTISFISFSLLLFGMLYLSVAMDKDTIQTETPTSDIPIKNDAYYSNMQESIHNILLTVENDNGLSHMAIISLQPEQDRTVIMPLPYNMAVNFNDDNISAAGLYNNQGIKPLYAAICNLTEISLDRYLTCTDEQFGRFIEAYGSLTLNIDDNVDFYYNDIPVRLTAGNHILDGQTASMLLYNKWSSSAFGSEHFFNKLLYSFFDKIYSNGYITDEKRFNKAINFANTDISYLDYLQLIQKNNKLDFTNYQTSCLDIATYIDPYSKTIKKDEHYYTILLQYFFTK